MKSIYNIFRTFSHFTGHPSRVFAHIALLLLLTAFLLLLPRQSIAQDEPAVTLYACDDYGCEEVSEEFLRLVQEPTNNSEVCEVYHLSMHTGCKKCKKLDAPESIKDIAKRFKNYPTSYCKVLVEDVDNDPDNNSPNPQASRQCEAKFIPRVQQARGYVGAARPVVIAYKIKNGQIFTIFDSQTLGLTSTAKQIKEGLERSLNANCKRSGHSGDKPTGNDLQ